MLEGLSQYDQIGPLWTGLLLVPFGLAVGSFCSVIRHRVARGESVVAPRSYCPSCRHTLGPVDLVPVLSYLALRGRCRHCRAPIPARYLVQELACGLGAGLAGALGGWTAAFAILAAWIAVVALVSGRGRPGEAGVTLVEVLIAVAVLVVVLVPILDFTADLRASTPFHRNMASSLAASKLEELGNSAYRTLTWSSTVSGEDDVQVGRYIYHREWNITGFSPSDNDFGAESTQLRAAEVAVTCVDCPKAVTPVRMVAVLAKL